MPATPAQRARAQRQLRVRKRRDEVPEAPIGWLESIFPGHFTEAFAPHHERFWEWVWSIEPGTRPDPLVMCLARKGGKSASVETSCVAVGAPIGGGQPRRNYVLYVSGTQGQADDHVKTIGAHLEDSRIAQIYPDLASARLTQYGDRWGWSRNRLVTEQGLIVDAYGLFGSGRGAKLEQYRPDYLVLDDIDQEDDSLEVVKKKERRIKQQVIPSGSSDRAILFIQNKVHTDSVMSRLLRGESDLLLKRNEIGPIPAIEDLSYRYSHDEEQGRYTYEVTGGEPTWSGFGLEDAEDELNEIGATSFEIEFQHDVSEVEGALWSGDQLEAVRVSTHPPLQRIIVAVDPSGGTSETGIVVIGLGVDGKGYVLDDRSMDGTDPNAWGREVLDVYAEYDADAVVAEKNQGGEMVRTTIVSAASGPVDVPVYLVHATRGKYTRAESPAAAYGNEEVDWQDTKVHHVGKHPKLETQMKTYVPGNDSPDRLDALVWGLRKLVVNEAMKDSAQDPPTSSSF